MAKSRSAKRRAQRNRRIGRERREYESIDFNNLSRELFITAVTYLAMHKARRREAEGHRVGLETENRFFSAFSRPDIELPAWFLGVRRASTAEDAQGIDAFVVADIGEIPLQIKSSVTGMLKFNEKRPGNNITILIVKREVSADQIVERTLDKITLQRRRIMIQDWNSRNEL